MLKHDDSNTNSDVDDAADAADAADGNTDDDAVLGAAASMFLISIPDAIDPTVSTQGFLL